MEGITFHWVQEEATEMEETPVQNIQVSGERRKKNNQYVQYIRTGR